MHVKEFLPLMPYLCNSKNAEREFNIIKYQYNDELTNVSSVFHKNKVDAKKPFNRLKTAFIFTGNIFKVNHCKNICKLLLLLHYKNEHKENQWDNKIKVLKIKVLVGGIINPSIAEVMPLENILSARWDG
jgi:hypothetical protein